ncbi:MAG: hypothetical protein ACOVRN_17260 [Flavobacterium sp.]
MKIPTALLLAFTSLTFISCQPTSPEEVLTAYLEKANHGEFEEAAKYADKESQSMLMFMASMTPAADKLKMMQQTVDINVVTADTKPDVAYVKVDLVLDKKKKSQGDFVLKKENGDWKVAMGERFNKVKEKEAQAATE